MGERRLIYYQILAHTRALSHTPLFLEMRQTPAGGTDARTRSLLSGWHPRDEVPEIGRSPWLFPVGSFQREAPKSPPQGQRQNIYSDGIKELTRTDSCSDECPLLMWEPHQHGGVNASFHVEKYKLHCEKQSLDSLDSSLTARFLHVSCRTV